MTKEENQFIKKYGDLGVELLKEHNYDVDRCIEAMEEYYEGEFNSREDFAKSHMQDRADQVLPQTSYEHRILSNYCNWEHVAWELFLGDYTDIEVGNKIHVFRSF